MKLSIIDHTAFHNERRADKGTLMPYSKTYAPVKTAILAEQFLSGEVSTADGNGGVNHSHYGEVIPGIDDLFDEIIAETDSAKQDELIRKAEMQILEDMPAFTATTMSLITLLGPRVDLGFEVVAGYPQYSLEKAILTNT